MTRRGVSSSFISTANIQFRCQQILANQSIDIKTKILFFLLFLIAGFSIWKFVSMPKHYRGTIFTHIYQIGVCCKIRSKHRNITFLTGSHNLIWCNTGCVCENIGFIKYLINLDRQWDICHVPDSRINIRSAKVTKAARLASGNWCVQKLNHPPLTVGWWKAVDRRQCYGELVKLAVCYWHTSWCFGFFRMMCDLCSSSRWWSSKV